MTDTASIRSGARHGHLDGATAIDLATDRPRPTAGPYRPGTERLPLPAATTARLDEVSGSAGVLPSITVLTAWAAVLHRHTGQTELLLGLAAGPQTGPAAGPTVLPLLLRLRPGAPFAEELARVRAAATDAIADATAAAAAVPHTAPPELRAVAGHPGERELRETAPDVALSLEREDGAAGLCLRYNTSLLSRSTAAWMLGHCLTLLEEALADPGRPVRELRVQDEPPADAWSLPAPAGFTAPAPAGPGETLVDRFLRTAATHADRTAVTGPSGALDYAGLERVTAAAARRLRRFGGPGKRVALLCDHDIGAVVGAWSVLRTGAAYVPLDPRQPDGRLTRLLLDVDAAAIVCDPGLAERASLLARGRQIVPLDPTDPGPTAEVRPGAGEPPTAGPDALAYLLHTSGSTGKPKAVMQTRGNVLAHALTYADRIRLGPGDQVPLLARHTFDAAVMDLYGALLTGATLHVLDPLLPAPRLRGRLADAGATVLHCTPTVFRHLTGDLAEDAAHHEATLGTVRVVVLGGEEAGQHDLRRFLRAFPDGTALVNGLGPTECTLVTQHLAGRADLGGGALPVGGPVEGVRIRLVDADGHPTELRGELEVRGERVAAGYWDQPEATAAAFGTAPDGTRFYRTGDLVRRRADGALVFLGRRDRQIKIRGHRIEPGEIEAVLRGHPTVAEAVLTVDTRRPTARLVAYVTPATAFPPDAEELGRYLARTLPEHAVPWRVVALERLPLGPTGKVDRAALPAPEEAPADTGDAPNTPTERAVAAVWCRVLGIPSARLHSNFVSSGGDSIQLLALLSELQAELGVELDLLEILAAPTVATMAHLIERENRC
ncbi:amino acid adenylation domain-containing protein [Kitasatospora purpeofusca]|uniref:amino acid adenylation domain-containing protein n=1 Tax=Kitasatospora purpeofusca TaxID=67352 RepID=UPI002A5A563F|nr:amino acid adenylation domain-containing protein [Kitasatospora purpeofusca]MDY0810749.1 amino acid adenylation domain-containing protein [Kitasatospora purpeofusca]